MRVLVAGGAGFLGSHLVDLLVAKGDEVLILDNYFTGSKSNLLHHLTNPRVEIIRHDVTMPFYVEVDQIFNLASPASPVHYQKFPVQTIKTNILGSINLLGLARRTGARILQASTSEIYGDPIESPQNEGYWGNVNPIGIRACYDEGKRASETLFFDYHRQYGIEIKVVRIFNTYGPRMANQDGRVISNFIVQALTNSPITIYGDGLQTRSFCYVSDLVKGICRMMNSESKFIGPVNLGNPNECTMLEVANLILKLTNSNSAIKFEPLPQDDPRRRKPDISLAKSELKWEPDTNFEQGLLETIDYFQQIIN
jgi:UDP-glucuronate decarboxylase